MTNADWLTKDFYKVLGVGDDASASEIKKAYRTLARANHPDSHPGDKAAEERFKAIAEAYDVVGDAEKRKQYDEMRKVGAGGFGPYTTGGAGGGQPFDLGDLFGQGEAAGAGGFGDLFGTMFGGRGRARAAQPRRGQDVDAETTISFEDAVEGVQVSLRLTSDAPCPACAGTGAKAGTVPRVCPDCDGAGMRAASVGGAFTMNETCATCRGRGMIVDDPCPTCHGSGRGLSSRTISARIPAGVADGQRIRLRGKGAPGERGGPPGDLYVTVHVAKHELFGRKADNLTLTVPTLGGAPVTVKIPPGTPNGRTFRVRGRGVQRKDGHKGDLLVTVEVQVPARLDEKAREAVEAYRDAMSDSDLRSRLFSARSPQ
jgi:molecular chaperone DnaJ